MILNIKGETQIVLKVTGQIDFVSHIDWSNWLWYDNIDFAKFCFSYKKTWTIYFIIPLK